MLGIVFQNICKYRRGEAKVEPNQQASFQELAFCRRTEQRGSVILYSQCVVIYGWSRRLIAVPKLS